MLDKSNFKILDSFESTSNFVDDVRKAADKNKIALGFLPKSVYEEFARRNELLVLAQAIDGILKYVGHLIFQCRYPKAHVIQIYCDPEFRRHGLASGLLSHLRASLEKDGFISISARVAEDLSAANSFWENQSFYIQRVEQGGATKNRQILVRLCELSTPQLFPASKLDSQNPLGLFNRSSDKPPLYLLDLNVLYDLFPRRLRHAQAISVFQAERMNLCRLALSSEANEELKRTKLQQKTDPMEAYLNIFAILPLLTEGSKELIDDLAKLIFPDKEKLDSKSLSDLKHIATSIQHRTTGLITNDNRLLNAASLIRAKFGIDVTSPSVFQLGSSDPLINAFEARQEISLELRPIVIKDHSDVRSLLLELMPKSEVEEIWLPIYVDSQISAHFGIWMGVELLGYAAITRTPPHALIVRAAVAEQNRNSRYASHLILMYVMEQATTYSPLTITLNIPSKQSYLKDFAFSMGFRGNKDGKSLVKVCLGCVMKPDNWNTNRAKLSTACGIGLPVSMPAYRSIVQPVEIITAEGNRTHHPLDLVETLLSPTLFCLNERPAVVTPIQRKFSHLLLNCSPQASLLPSTLSSVFVERHYFSSAQNLKKFKKGTLILFYESKTDGGQGAVIAIARTREAYLRTNNALTENDYERSIFDPSNIKNIGDIENITVTAFDNVFRLSNPVPLRRLKEIGCGRPNDLIRTNSISNEQLQTIVKEGFNRG